MHPQTVGLRLQLGEALGLQNFLLTELFYLRVILLFEILVLLVIGGGDLYHDRLFLHFFDFDHIGLGFSLHYWLVLQFSQVSCQFVKHSREATTLLPQNANVLLLALLLLIYLIVSLNCNVIVFLGYYNFAG